MAASHDNFFVTTLIDRTDGKSSRVSDMVDTTVGNTTRIPFSGNTTTTTLGIAKLYGFTGTLGAIITLSDNLHALGSPEKPYVLNIVDEGGNASVAEINFDTESGTISGSSSLSINTDFGGYILYSDGTNFFVISKSAM